MADPDPKTPKLFPEEKSTVGPVAVAEPNPPNAGLEGVDPPKGPIAAGITFVLKGLLPAGVAITPKGLLAAGMAFGAVREVPRKVGCFIVVGAPEAGVALEISSVSLATASDGVLGDGG